VDPIPATQATTFCGGASVELAGYGRTEDGTSGQLRFVVESVRTEQDGIITVDGGERSGACEGDSGGPLLARAAGGKLAVVGILSMGSVLCRGQDEYVSASQFGRWIADVAAGAAP
jgi:hypothetical protein